MFNKSAIINNFAMGVFEKTILYMGVQYMVADAYDAVYMVADNFFGIRIDFARGACFGAVNIPVPHCAFRAL